MRKSRRKMSPWESPVPTNGSFKRRVRSTHEDDQVPPVDVTIIYSGDAAEWDTYLTDCVNYNYCLKTEKKTGKDKLVVHHEQLEEIPLQNMPSSRASSLASSKVTLVVISPDFVDYIESHPEVYELGKLLKPANTVAMLCGVRERDIGGVHRAALVSYNDWKRLVAKDQDKEFVLSVVETIREILNSVQEAYQKLTFKITPRKVREGHNKVFVLLDQPATNQVQIFLDGISVPVKQRNPYTLQFIVPECNLKVSKILNVHIRSQGVLLGVHPLKVDSVMGELSNILSSVVSPYELICRTLGVSSIHEVDRFLVDKFNQRLPPGLKSDWLFEALGEGAITNSKEELPTILHFAACYGLKLFVRTLLDCPGGQDACFIRNAKGMSPAQLANYAGHHDIAALFEENKNISGSWSKGSTRRHRSEPNVVSMAVENRSYVNVPEMNDPNEHYDIPCPNPKLVVLPPEIVTKTETNTEPPEENLYLDMKGFTTEPLLPHQLLLQGQLGSCEDIPVVQEYETASDLMASCAASILPDEEPNAIGKPTGSQESLNYNDFCQDVINTIGKGDECQAQDELVKILKGFKQGRQMSLIQKDVEDWKQKHDCTLSAEASLQGLRETFQKKKIAKKSKGSFGFIDFFTSKNKPRVQTPKEPVISDPDQPVESNLTSQASGSITDMIADEDIGNRPISTLSSASSSCNSRASTASNLSSISVGSICDSGNHSDSCDELGLTRLKTSLSQCSLTSSPKTRKISVSKRPPAPPPRIRVSAVEQEMTTVRETEPSSSSSMTNPEYMQSTQEEPTTVWKRPLPTIPIYRKSRDVEQALGPKRVEDCYWVPPPPLPLWAKKPAHSPTIGLYIQEQDYDIPKSPRTVLEHTDYDIPRNLTPRTPKLGTSPGVSSYHYVYPKSIKGHSDRKF